VSGRGPRGSGDQPVVEWSTRGCIYASFLVESPYVLGNHAVNKDRRVSLGTFLRQARTTAGLTTREVAAACGIDMATVVRIEGGKIASPAPEKLRAIAACFGISLADIFTMAGYVIPDDLPSIDLYLQTKYPQLPPVEIQTISTHVEALVENTPRAVDTTMESIS